MRIQLTLALVLTAMTAAACQFEWKAGAAPLLTGAAPVRRPAPPPPPSPPPRQTPAAAPTAKPPAAPTTGVASKAPVLGPADIEALLRGTWRSLPPIVLPGGGGPGPAPIPGAPACLSVTASATVPPCTLRIPDLVCLTSMLPAQHCRTYATTMVPTVAAAAVACMNRLTSTQLCDPMQIDNCGHAALAQTCPDPATVGPLCQIASEPCRSSQVECVALLSGLTADGQDAVARCVAQGCSAGLYACVEGLGSPSPLAPAASAR